MDRSIELAKHVRETQLRFKDLIELAKVRGDREHVLYLDGWLMALDSVAHKLIQLYPEVVDALNTNQQEYSDE